MSPRAWPRGLREVTKTRFGIGCHAQIPPLRYRSGRDDKKKNNAPQNDEKKGRNKQEENLFLLSGVKNLKVLLEIA